MTETHKEKAKGGEMRHLMVKEIEKRLRASSLFVTQYQGLSVKDLDELRGKLRSAEGRYFVAKNNLSRIALKSIGMESSLIETITGQAGFVVGDGDAILLSKALMGFAKDHEAIKVCGGVIDGEFLGPDKIRDFAKLPSKDVLIGKTVTLINAPLSNFAGVLAGTVRKFLYALEGIRKKKEGQEETS